MNSRLSAASVLSEVFSSLASATQKEERERVEKHYIMAGCLYIQSI